MSQHVGVKWWPLWWSMEGQDPKCNVPGVTAYGTVTDPTILPFHIRMSSINRTRNQQVVKTHWLLLSQLCKHQQVITTCWCFFLVLPRLQQPQPAPMSHNDLLVLFFRFSLDYGSHNKHQQVVATCWCFFHFFLDHAGHNQHQQVIKTRWCLFLLLPQLRQPQPAPTSRYDLLVLFFASTLTTQATTSTSKSLRPAGAIFRFFLNHIGHNQHQWVIMTHWCYFSLLPRPCRPQQAPASPYDSLVLFFPSLTTTQATTPSFWLDVAPPPLHTQWQW